MPSAVIKLPWQTNWCTSCSITSPCMLSFWVLQKEMLCLSHYWPILLLVLSLCIVISCSSVSFLVKRLLLSTNQRSFASSPCSVIPVSMLLGYNIITGSVARLNRYGGKIHSCHTRVFVWKYSMIFVYLYHTWWFALISLAQVWSVSPLFLHFVSLSTFHPAMHCQMLIWIYKVVEDLVVLNAVLSICLSVIRWSVVLLDSTRLVLLEVLVQQIVYFWFISFCWKPFLGCSVILQFCRAPFCLL